jgi:hypothetical protein
VAGRRGCQLGWCLTHALHTSSGTRSPTPLRRCCCSAHCLRSRQSPVLLFLLPLIVSSVQYNHCRANQSQARLQTSNKSSRRRDETTGGLTQWPPPASPPAPAPAACSCCALPSGRPRAPRRRLRIRLRW